MINVSLVAGFAANGREEIVQKEQNLNILRTDLPRYKAFASHDFRMSLDEPVGFASG